MASHINKNTEKRKILYEALKNSKGNVMTASLESGIGSATIRKYIKKNTVAMRILRDKVSFIMS